MPFLRLPYFPLLTSLLFLGCHHIGISQPLYVTNYSLNEGLLHSDAEDVLIDSKGFVWITSYSGVTKWDGIKSKGYQYNHLDSSGLWNNVCVSIFEDQNEELWVGTLNGLNRYHGPTDNFERIPLLNDSIRNTAFNVIKADSKAQLWFGSSDGLFYLENNGCKRIEATTGLVIFDMAIEKTGSIWLATFNKGLVQYNPATNQCTYYSHDIHNKNSICSDKLRSVCLSADHQVWVGSEDQGISVLNLLSNQWTHYKTLDPNENITTQHVIDCIYEDRQHTIWIGVKHSLPFIFDRNRQVCHPQKLVANNKHGKLCRSVYHFREDPFGNLWMATAGDGLFRYHTADKLFHTAYALTGSKQENTFKIATDFAENPLTDEIIVASEAGVLSYSDSQQLNVLIQDQKLLSIESDQNGNIWACGWKTGLIMRDHATGAIRKYRHDDHNENSIITDDIKALAIQDSLIWLGTHGSGVSVFNTRSQRFIDYRNNEYFNFNLSIPSWVNHLFIDNQNRVWVSTYGGLYCINEQQIKAFNAQTQPIALSCNEVNMSTQDSVGMLWIATDCGLLRYDEKKQQIENWSDLYPIPNKVKSVIAQGSTLWLGTESGLIKINWRTKELQIFNEEDGLQSDVFTQKACFATSDGRLLFGGNKGFTVIHPEIEFKSHANAELYLQNILINGIPQYPEGPFTTLITDQKSCDSIFLTYDQTSIEIDYSTVGAFHQSADYYKYRIKGLDNKFYTTSNSGAIVIQHLNPGSYILQIYRSNSHGQEPTKELHIWVDPPFWQTLWFKIVVIFLPLFAIFTFIMIRLYTAKKQNVRLEKQVKLRTQELQESHDDLKERNEKIVDQREELSLKNGELQRQYIHLVSQQALLYRKTKKQKIITQASDSSKEFLQAPMIHTSAKEQMTLLMYVETEEIREHVQEILSDHYILKIVVEKTNLIEEIKETLPEIICLGTGELNTCKAIQESLEISHIPILLLASKEEPVILDNPELQADYYLNTEQINTGLLSKIRQIREDRSSLYEQLFQPQSTNFKSDKLTKTNQSFLNDIQGIIESKLSNPDLDASILSKELLLSRSNLYAKVKSLTGLGVHDFIKKIRLQRSIELLKNQDLTVNEVAYEVGFSSPSYYIRSFKKVYETSPKKYISK